MTELPPHSAFEGEESFLKFILCARRKREDTQERYFYEWGNIHVSLMLTTPEVMAIFKRYAQHYVVAGVSDDMLVFPRSPMEWDNMADHWLAGYEDLLLSVTAQSYVQRMQPHAFGDKAFHLALTRGKTLFRRPGFQSGGGVKLIHWFKKRQDVSVEDFSRQWRNVYAPAFLDTAGGGRLIRKYVQNRAVGLDPAMFQGTLFAHGDVGEFAGIEEIWFDDLEALAQVARNPTIADTVRNGTAGFVDPNGSFSMVTTERVVYDFVTPGEISPPPAILNPDSLEARAVAQGYRDWAIPKPAADQA